MRPVLAPSHLKAVISSLQAPDIQAKMVLQLRTLRTGGYRSREGERPLSQVAADALLHLRQVAYRPARGCGRGDEQGSSVRSERLLCPYSCS